LNNDQLGYQKILELMEAVDAWIEEPLEMLKAFLMPEDMSQLSWNCSYRSYRNRGCNTGDPVEIIGMGAEKLTSITGVEMFRKILDRGEAGDNVGIL
jgi:elongation factor Tu